MSCYVICAVQEHGHLAREDILKDTSVHGPVGDAANRLIVLQVDFEEFRTVRCGTRPNQLPSVHSVPAWPTMAYLSQDSESPARLASGYYIVEAQLHAGTLKWHLFAHPEQPLFSVQVQGPSVLRRTACASR